MSFPTFKVLTVILSITTVLHVFKGASPAQAEFLTSYPLSYGKQEQVSPLKVVASDTDTVAKYIVNCSGFVASLKDENTVVTVSIDKVSTVPATIKDVRIIDSYKAYRIACPSTRILANELTPLGARYIKANSFRWTATEEAYREEFRALKQSLALVVNGEEPAPTVATFTGATEFSFAK